MYGSTNWFCRNWCTITILWLDNLLAGVCTAVQTGSAGLALVAAAPQVERELSSQRQALGPGDREFK